MARRPVGMLCRYRAGRGLNMNGPAGAGRGPGRIGRRAAAGLPWSIGQAGGGLECVARRRNNDRLGADVAQVVRARDS